MPANFLGSRSVLKTQSQVDVPQKGPNFSYSNSQISTRRDQRQENSFFKKYSDHFVGIMVRLSHIRSSVAIALAFFIIYLDLTDPIRKRSEVKYTLRYIHSIQNFKQEGK